MAMSKRRRNEALREILLDYVTDPNSNYKRHNPENVGKVRNMIARVGKDEVVKRLRKAAGWD